MIKAATKQRTRDCKHSINKVNKTDERKLVYFLKRDNEVTCISFLRKMDEAKFGSAEPDAA